MRHPVGPGPLPASRKGGGLQVGPISFRAARIVTPLSRRFHCVLARLTASTKLIHRLMAYARHDLYISPFMDQLAFDQQIGDTEKTRECRMGLLW